MAKSATPALTKVKAGPGPRPMDAAEDVSSNGSRPQPTTDHAASMRDVLLEQKSYTPNPSVVEYFLTFDIQPEAAWIRAGLTREDLERKRRIVTRLMYVLMGSSDPQASLLISLAGIAGLDGRAVNNAKEVLTNVRVLPPMGDQLTRFQNPGQQQKELG